MTERSLRVLEGHCDARYDDHADHAALTHALPGQTQHERVELGATQSGVGLSRCRPDELALVQPARSQPDADAVVHQHLEAVGALVGEQVDMVRLRRTEDRHHPGQCCVGARAHVQRLARQPNRIDSDHRNHSRSQAAHSPVADTGQLTLTVAAPRRTSMRMSAGGAGVGSGGASTGKAMKGAGDGCIWTARERLASRRHLCTRLALSP